jgi:hypothetical protein
LRIFFQGKRVAGMVQYQPNKFLVLLYDDKILKLFDKNKEEYCDWRAIKCCQGGAKFQQIGGQRF